MTDHTDWLEFWYLALGSQFGIVLAVSDVELARQRLYQVRAKSGDPDLAGVTIRVSPVLPHEEIWLIKAAPKAAAPPAGVPDGKA